jgi:hypothetical protein
MDNYSDDLNVEVLLSKDENDEKFSQVTKELDHMYKQKREGSGISSHMLVNIVFKRLLLTHKIILITLIIRSKCF